MLRSLFLHPIAFYKARFSRWLDRRLLPSRQQTLNNRRLFIFPYGAGWGAIGTSVLLWLLGTNYDNNLILGLAFFLCALFIVAIYHTFFNLAGLTVQFIQSAPAFAGEDAEVELDLSRLAGAKENIELNFPGGRSSRVDLIDESSRRVKLFVPAKVRGRYRPGRLVVQSYFPLGLLRCWSWLDLQVEVLVYPKPLAGAPLPLGSGHSAEGDLRDAQGAEDFHGFKHYEAGMPLRHIAWKQYARGQGLYSKEYVSFREQSLWLDWSALVGGRELRLSQLCYWVLRLAATTQPYGLRLPGVALSPASGLEHKLQVLRALALYESEGLQGDRT